MQWVERTTQIYGDVIVWRCVHAAIVMRSIGRKLSSEDEDAAPSVMSAEDPPAMYEL